MNSTGSLKELNKKISLLKKQLEQKTTELAELKQKCFLEHNQKQNLIINNVKEGIAVHEMIFDKNGMPEDMLWLHVNPEYEKLTELKRNEIIGRRTLDIIPELDKKWIEVCGRVLKSGKPFTTKVYAKPLDRYWRVTAFGLDDNQLGVAMTDVDNEVKSEGQIEQHTKNYQHILDSQTEAVYILDSKMQFQYVNRGAEKMYGYSREEMIGMTPVEVSAPNKNNLEYVSGLLKEVLDKGGTKSFEFWGLRKGKDEFFKEVIINKGRYFDQDVIIATARDVTETRLAREKLKVSEERFRALYDNAPLSYHSLDIDGNLIDVNPTWLNTLGYSREEAIGRNFSYFLHPDWKQHFKANFGALKKQGYINDIQFRMRQSNGHFIYVSLNGSVGYNADNTFKQGYCVFSDITTQKEAEMALLESEAKFRGVFEHANIGIAIADIDINILEVNNEYLEMLGYARDELIGKNARAISYADDFIREKNLVDDLIKNGKSDFRIEKRYYHKSGKIIWADLAMTAKRNAIGEIDMFIGMVMDITESKKTQEELIKAKEKAEESDRLKSAFLANMSHEIRTPMNGILGFAKLLESPNLSNDQQKQYVKIIKKSGDRMLNTVNDIIDISRIDAGQVKVEKTDVYISELMENLYAFFLPEAARKGLKFELKGDNNATDLILNTDKSKLSSVITNLIKNAIKYTDKGGVTVTYEHKDNWFKLFVEDTGIGIPMNRISAIFNRFEQADIDDSYAREGSGLGLAIAKSYAEMLGGSISVVSRPETGSTFCFTHPLRTESCCWEKKEVLVSETPDLKNQKLKILIAEDDYISYCYLKMVLEDLCSDIYRAVNGEEVVNIIKQNQDIDCVLMDVKMPVMDGYRASIEIRTFNSDVIIIAQTAYALEGEYEKAIASGCNDYISKPINEKVLVNKLKQLCKKELR